LIVGADNVGSKHMQGIRMQSRGKSELLMGKNTMMRKAIKGHIAKNADLAAILPYIVGNIGLVFSHGDLKTVRDQISSNKKEAAARVGSIAPCDVFIEAGNTTLDPSMTAFMQALNISTRINKGVIEIINKIHLIKKGEKVNSSQAALLQKLEVQPFAYGLIPLQVYDSGLCYPASALDVSEGEILSKITFGIQRVAALSLQISHPTAAAVPHYIGRAYRDLCSVSLASDYTFDRIAKLKALLSDPAALAAAQAAQAAASAPTASAPSASSAPAAKAKVEVKKEEVKEAEEEEEDGGFGGLFD